jgi:TetR/AcrR family transcriptional regulator
MKSAKVKIKSGRQSNEVSEQTKTKILISALNIFAQEGFHNASLRDIASLAGTTHNLIRHHFGSKEDLWKAAVDYKINIHAENLRKILNETESTDPVFLLKSFIKEFVSYTAGNTELAKIFLSNYSKNSYQLEYLLNKQKIFLDLTYPIFKKVQLKGYFKNFNHASFAVYLTSLVETPIVTSYFTNKIIKLDICSEKGIAFHSKNIIRILFHEDE